MEKTQHRQPLWIQQFYGLPNDRKEAEERPVTIVSLRKERNIKNEEH